MSDDTQIAKIGNNLPQPGRPQQPIQANLNQYGNDSTQIAYLLRHGGGLGQRQRADRCGHFPERSCNHLL